MILLLAILLGAAIGGAARAAAPRRMPRRLDVATILSAVGALLGALGFVISSAVWSLRSSTGILAAAAAGAIAILIAYALLPVLASSLTRTLPGRSSTPSPAEKSAGCEGEIDWPLVWGSDIETFLSRNLLRRTLSRTLPLQGRFPARRGLEHPSQHLHTQSYLLAVAVPMLLLLANDGQSGVQFHGGRAAGY